MLLADDDEQVPELPTDREKKALTDALTSERLLAIDETILSATGQR